VPSDTALAQLRTLLRRLQQACTTLQDTLNAEGDAIRKRDMPALMDCGESKQRQLAELETLKQQRRDCLAALGWAEDNPLPDAAAAELWRETLKSLESCQEINQVNGTMLQIQHSQIEKVLHLVAGAEGSSGLYQADGLTNRMTARAPIAKA